MAPNINNPGGDKNEPDEIRDGVVSDATRFPGGFIDQQITQAGAAIQIVGQFQLPNATFTQTFDVGGQDTFPTGVTFSADGSRLYIIGDSTTNVYQYSLSTSYDVSTASLDQSFDVSTQETGPRGLAFKPDGTSLYVIGRDSDTVFQYSLSTGFDISTASLNVSFDVSTQEDRSMGVTFRPDGTQMYVMGRTNEAVFEYSLSTSYDVSTASFTQSFSVSGQDNNPRSVAFDSDGQIMYVVGANTDTIYQYAVSTPFDVSTASLTTTLDVSARGTVPTGLVFKPDGSHMYVTRENNATVEQYAVGLVGSELG
jgi:6-phosphogluconolactonase (cycloisomerase 2 family)